jgi:hypothetical protein
MQTINFIFSIGFRCYSTDFLNKFKLRKFSGPFDYLFIDLETSFKIINDKFDNYLCDIILFNKNLKKIELFYKKNTIDIDKMAYNHNHDNLIFNQNYLYNKLNKNLYEWETICSFHHHNILDNNIYNSIKQRCERFNNILDKYNETTALFYITKIVNYINIVDYMNKIIELKQKYCIKCFVIIIINCDNIEDDNYFNENNKCLFIIKKVANYENQLSKNQVDNNLDYKNEFDIILKYFTVNLIEKTNI